MKPVTYKSYDFQLPFEDFYIYFHFSLSAKKGKILINIS